MSVQVKTAGIATIADNAELVGQILQAIKGVRHGHVQIIIQDSRVVQIDRTEKLRLA